MCMKVKKIRSVVKTISWRIVGTIDTMFLGWLITGSPLIGLKIGALELVTKFVDFIKNCDMTPFWLQRFKKYVETDKLTECPPELAKLCNRLSIKGD